MTETRQLVVYKSMQIKHINMTTWTKYIVKNKNLKGHILILLIELLNYKTVWGKHKDADSRAECCSLNSSKAAVLLQNEL